jgi:hypothetical protein
MKRGEDNSSSHRSLSENVEGLQAKKLLFPLIQMRFCRHRCVVILSRKENLEGELLKKGVKEPKRGGRRPNHLEARRQEEE